MKQVARLRKSYKKGFLDENEAPDNPYELFEKWLNEAISSSAEEATAMVLSTVGKDFKPSSRVILLKDYEKNTFSFFTNYLSRKGREISINPYASLLFFWAHQERQVRIEGKVKKTSRKESIAYFETRPAESRISSIVSKQSQILSDRKILEKEVDSFIRSQKEISLPEYWGGYTLHAHYYEFWQGREHRLHDRLVYHLENKQWIVKRLYP